MAEQRSRLITIAEPWVYAGFLRLRSMLTARRIKRRAVPEIISAAGFKNYFRDLVDRANAGPQALGELCNRYGLEMDLSSLATLIERFGVRLS